MKNMISGPGARRIFSLIFSCILMLSAIHAQLPQGFKYQTIVRNNAGLAIASDSISFRLSILAGSSTGTAVYVEAQSVKSSPLGVVSLMVGAGTPVTSTFNLIDWSSGNYYLQVEVEAYGASTYSMMGTSQLVSVPYALYAKSSGAGQWSGDSKSISYNGSVGIGGIVNQDTALTDTILFEVKDRYGSPVFRVQESGVRVFVSSGTKGARGGFVVGGKSTAKGTGPELMMITNDSIRLYVDDVPAKGSKGGFAIGGRTPSVKGPAVNFIHLTPDNTFIGKESGINNTDGYGIENVFLGNQSGYTNTAGVYNIFIGAEAGYTNTLGYNNVFVGNSSGFANDTGYFNVFLGNYSGSSNVDGYSNIYIGDQSGGANIDGNQNVYVGDYSGANDTAGKNNVFIGAYAGSNSVDAGFHNIFVGANTGNNIDAGTYNNFVGTNAGYYISNGNYNNFLGDETGYNTTTGNGNLFLGDWAGRDNEDGSDNVYLGRQSGLTNISGSGNVFLGHNAGYYESGSNRLYISNDSSDNTTALIYGEFDTKNVQVNGNFTVNGSAYCTLSIWSTSDIRFKKNILPLENTLDKINMLTPVTFNWKTDEFKDKGFDNSNQIGLIAQEVEKLFPELVKTGPDGYKAVDYSKLTAVLIQGMKDQQQIISKQQSDFEKQQQVILKQQSNLDQQQKSINILNDENKVIKQQLQDMKNLQSELDKIKAAIGMSSSK
jgi:hypothetical protein